MKEHDSQLPYQRIRDRGIDFLRREQQADGSFLCLASGVFDNYTQADVVPAIVPTNIVLSSLALISAHPGVDLIKRRAADFLLKEKSEYWSFNYWFRASEPSTQEPYPDDLDDTFCALAALYEYDPRLFDGEVMARIATMLTSAESEEGGPYEMWLVPQETRDRWHRIDLVVNSNIGFFLSLHDVSLPKLNAFIEQSIDDEDYEFPYNTIYPSIYFISRFYHGQKIEKMIQLLLSRQDQEGKWENPLRTALAMTSLMNLAGNRYRSEIEKAAAYLERSQQEDGSWPVASFFYQTRLPDKTSYAGSAATTTALCIEALERVMSFPSGRETTSRIPQETIFCDRIRNIVHARFASSDRELQFELRKMCDQLLMGDLGTQIMLPAYFFRQALGAVGNRISDDIVLRLGAANAFGWIAYTAYDDMQDAEGDARQIPLANMCLRSSIELFLSVLPANQSFEEMVQRTFDEMDRANAWELTHARTSSVSLPLYGDCTQLASRSMGHALGPIAILFLLGFREGFVEFQYVQDFFTHFLIARQLDDDMHDWQEDLQRGQINVVLSWIAQDLKLSLPLLTKQPIEKLQKQFWEVTVLRACEEIESHLSKARDALARFSLMTSPAALTHLLSPMERSIQKTRKERAEAMQFTQTYRPS